MQTTTQTKYINSLQEHQPSLPCSDSLYDLRSEIGIWREAHTSWLREGEWRFAPIYRRTGGIKLLTAYQTRFHLHVTVIERALSNHTGYHRQVFIRNDATREQEIKVVLHQKPFLDRKDPAMSFYAPLSKALIHYDGVRYTTTFAKGAEATTTECAVGELEKVWQEKKGQLTVQPLSARVNESTITTAITLRANEETSVDQWVHVSQSMAESESFLAQFHKKD
ncbi:hypothetical protein RYX56_02200 [Alkalihalophilus lindianensis]|uniref:Uncharacterized protein n=1 Tax=Alkalihalophilus lindianensis TaxID=1630542 RepID=A0ABU3X6D1_9BACI|nr:hypothetical protein [Alkalihalophilus lindianensis]MDV2683177.1 hypothetical protein [Alkalihalophilus lindianensis]